MKNKSLLIIFAAVIMSLASCENELDRSVHFDVTASTSTGVLTGASFSLDAGTPVTFNFTGDPDFITFYSGETGHEFSKKDLLEVPVDEITSVLKFDNMPQYGTIPNSLKLYVSTDFTGITGKDKTGDSTMVVNHQWNEISTSANFSTASNTTNKTEINLNEYLGKKLTIAFKYDPQQNIATQPTWVLTDLLIENTLKSSGTTSQIKASAMGFTALDMVSKTPYKNDGGSGVWDLRNIAKSPSVMRIQSSPSNQPINEDWLISYPVVINSRPADTGVSIKKMSVDLESYEYTFNTPGTFIVTFVARNSNYEHYSEIVKDFTVTVK